VVVSTAGLDIIVPLGASCSPDSPFGTIDGGEVVKVSNPRTIPVGAGNADQAAAWDGAEGAYWAAHARHFDESIAAHHRRFMDALEIAAGSRVLDVGCGTGQTTRDAGRVATNGSALGVDLSARMLEV